MHNQSKRLVLFLPKNKQPATESIPFSKTFDLRERKSSLRASLEKAPTFKLVSIATAVVLKHFEKNEYIFVNL